MYKARYKIWLIILGVAFVLNILPPFFNWFINPSEVLLVKVDTKYNNSLTEQLNGIEKAGYSIKTASKVDKNYDIIIKDSSNEEIEGYTRIESLYTSPIVLFTKQKATNSNSGFIQYDKKMDNPPLYKDIDLILRGLLEDKSWLDIGISGELVKGKIKIVIPKDNSSYYLPVVKSIYLALNKGNELTLDDIINLEPEVNIILSKCTQVEDISQFIYNFYKNSLKSTATDVVTPDFMAIGPEFIMNSNVAFEKGNSDAWLAVYSNNMYEISLDAYIKGDSSYIDNVTKFLSHKKIASYTSLRQTYRTFILARELYDFRFAPEVLNTIFISSTVNDSIEKSISKRPITNSKDTTNLNEETNEEATEEATEKKSENMNNSEEVKGEDIKEEVKVSRSGEKMLLILISVLAIFLIVFLGLSMLL